MPLSMATFLSNRAEDALREIFETRDWEFSRPVLFPTHRSNLVVAKKGNEIRTCAVLESESNVWVWTQESPPPAPHTLLFTPVDIPQAFLVNTLIIVALAEENARRWEMQDPERDRALNTSRRIWLDQLSDWLL